MLFKKPKSIDDRAEFAEDLLERIKDVLFPMLQVMRDRDGRWFHFDTAIDSNLMAALSDLQTGFNDPASQKTIESMITRLLKVRQLLDVTAKLDDRVEYYVVDDGTEPDEPIENRVVASDSDVTL